MYCTTQSNTQMGIPFMYAQVCAMENGVYQNAALGRFKEGIFNLDLACLESHKLPYSRPFSCTWVTEGISRLCSICMGSDIQYCIVISFSEAPRPICNSQFRSTNGSDTVAFILCGGMSSQSCKPSQSEQHQSYMKLSTKNYICNVSQRRRCFYRCALWLFK